MRKDKLYIPVLLGTSRNERESEKAARYIFDLFEKREEVKTEIIDVRNIVMSETIPSWVESPVVEKWRNTASKMDGLLIVTPEYNHGYPGELKMLLDSALKEYEKKPVAVCGVSDGQYGGARVVDNLKPTLVTMGLVPIKRAVLFDHIDKLFDQKGKLKEEGRWQKKAEGLFDELIWYSRVLKEGKENYPLKK